jgi:hypothetical protein
MTNYPPPLIAAASLTGRDQQDCSLGAAVSLGKPLRVRVLHEGHRAYLPQHGKRVFKRGGCNG